MLLAGDIGGTKTNLAIFSGRSVPREPVAEKTYASDHYPSLDEMVLEFLAEFDLDLEQACFGVAGPVVDGRATITNLPWVIDESHLRESLKLSSVTLINDLEAVAQAVPVLRADDLHTINIGQPSHGKPMAVIAPGTGLGEAYLTWDGNRYQVHSSEGGHADFAPTNLQEIDLLAYLLTKYEHVSYERVCSGIGIPNIYEFFKQREIYDEPDWLSERISAAPDPTPIIVNAALDEDRKCELCTETLTTFISILGAEAGNMALNLMALGGVYLGGGIPPRILSALKHPRFMESFSNKGRFSSLASRIPVKVITNPKAGLIGAAYSCWASSAERVSIPEKT